MSKQQNLQNANENEIRELIAQRVRTAMKHLSDEDRTRIPNDPTTGRSALATEFLPDKQFSGPETDLNANGSAESAAGVDPADPALALMPFYLFRPDRVAAWLKQQKFRPDCIRIGAAGAIPPIIDHRRTILADTPLQRQQLIAELERYRHILIITPTLETISALAESDDSRFDVLLALRPLLWGHSVTMLLDFEPPRHRRAFARLADSLNTLDQMGVILQKLEDPGDPMQSGAKDLVTARDVENASRRGIRVIATHNAIITHLAVDTARDLGVTIEQPGSDG